MIPFALEHSFWIFSSPKKEKVMNMRKKGRRECLGEATVGALTVPAVLQGGVSTGQTAGE